MNQHFFITGQLQTLNAALQCRGQSAGWYSNSKREQEDKVFEAAKFSGFNFTTECMNYAFVWQTMSKKYDKDNIAFAKKFIFDALKCKSHKVGRHIVKEGRYIPNDTWKYVDSFFDGFMLAPPQTSCGCHVFQLHDEAFIEFVSGFKSCDNKHDYVNAFVKALHNTKK